MRSKVYILLFFLIIKSSFSQDLFSVDSCHEKSRKSALVILNGFGSSKDSRLIQQDFFNDRGYDLFIPDFINRSSLEKTVSNFISFYYDNLEEYKEVKFLCYILGGYVLNEHINSNGIGNITSIIYDRSPVQERAPVVAVSKIPLLSFLLYGNVIFEFSLEKICNLEDSRGVNIGMIIESKATKFMKVFRKYSLNYGGYNFSPEEIDSNFDDYFYTYLDHDEMYTNFDVIGHEIFYFLSNGKFSKNAKREQYNFNPFSNFPK
tara:strand:- start:11311 stop:12096 length:786 start_codon:yes stop_codon:yes gene_type:complete